MTHTKRLWVFDEANGRVEAIVDGGRRRKTVAFIAAGDVSNGKMIAAVPDLLEALEELMMILKDTTLPTAVEGYVRAAIAKARGAVDGQYPSGL